ncbi:hypothetical protein UlMin_041911 [Ulmus minor]
MLLLISQISFVVFFSATLDNTPSASARCRLAIALPSISFHLPSSVISSGLSPIAAKQLSFLKTAFILIFHKEKLFSLNFSISYFSCLALRYDAFLLREFKSISNRGLEVSFMEWIDFAEQSLEYGFHAIVIKACENAQLCFPKHSKADAKAVECFNNVEVIEKRLKECAITFDGLHSGIF